jgi:hypothetical protein
MTKDIQRSALAHINTGRSLFQLKHFVIAQHDTPEMQYRQVLIEAQSLIYNIKSAELDIKKTEIEISRLQATGDEIDNIEAEKKKLGLEMTKMALESARKELGYLEQIFGELPSFTDEQIEENQEEYWIKRLERQAQIDSLAVQSGVSTGNIQSLLNAGIIEHLELDRKTNEIR